MLSIIPSTTTATAPGLFMHSSATVWLLLLPIDVRAHVASGTAVIVSSLSRVVLRRRLVRLTRGIVCVCRP